MGARQEWKEVPELIDAIDEDGLCFCLVRVEIDNEKAVFRFGVSRSGYMAVKRILQMRPFDQMPGLSHRYFALPGGGQAEGNRALVRIKITSGRNVKQIETDVPLELAKNLTWFSQLKDLADAKHLLCQSLT